MLQTFPRRSAALKRHAGAVLALALLASFPQGVSAQHAGPFAHLAGAWSGTGTIQTTNGTRERIRCRAQYVVGEGGHAVNQGLQCASDSFKVVIVSDVRDEGGKVTGTWAETTRNVSGSLSGTVDDVNILANVGGPGFTAGLAIATRGANQTVQITPHGGTEIVSVTVSLRKG
jgi:hypothetical protein